MSTYNEKTNDYLYNYGTFPRLDYPNENGQLTWYPIGFSNAFSKNPTQITIWDTNYIVWKDKTQYYGMRDACSHQGSSFRNGKTCGNEIMCPYHGYSFNGKNGELMKIPKLEHIKSCSHTIDSFKVVERGDMVYFNTIPIKNEDMREQIQENQIFVEPEFHYRDHRPVFLEEMFEHYAKLVTVNSLDICHIGFVHTFGNKENPNPVQYSKIIKLNDYENHYKIVYEYLAGEKSLVSQIYGMSNITVENEYVLPHSTVARVKFGGFASTIITHALPISKFKTKLFVKAYRSYWSHDMKNRRHFGLLYPVYRLINRFGDIITKKTMYVTLKQDKEIIDNIDKKNYESMHGKFSIVFDILSNHYKNSYKKIYENIDFDM
jgi:phenylpropionate dioxygenase-like ring-hydroxylating dioxygenase large terminal subunit